MTSLALGRIHSFIHLTNMLPTDVGATNAVLDVMEHSTSLGA